MPLLGLAALAGHAGIVELLLKRGARIEARSLIVDTVMFMDDEVAFERMGATALGLAAREGCLEVVEILLRARASLEACDQNEKTPLMLAAEGGHLPLVLRLLEAGARMDHRAEGRTALDLAAIAGKIRVVRLLEARGCPGNLKKAWNEALRDAAVFGFLGKAKLAIRNGANVDCRSGGGLTPLMDAARMGHLTLAKYLLEQGADARLKGGSRQRTALYYATDAGKVALANLLRLRVRKRPASRR
jgi:uncharacterized protein